MTYCVDELMRCIHKIQPMWKQQRRDEHSINNYKLHHMWQLLLRCALDINARCTRFDGILARFNNTQKKFRRCRAGYVLRIFEHPFRLECGVMYPWALDREAADKCDDATPDRSLCFRNRRCRGVIHFRWLQCVHTHVHTHIMCTHTHTATHMCTYVRVYTHTHAHVRVRTHVYIFTHMYVHVYTCIHTHAHTYTCTRASDVWEQGSGDSNSGWN